MTKKSDENRRQFLGRGVASLAVLSGRATGAAARPAQADDLVVLGRSGLSLSRLALGLGTGEAEAFQQMGPSGFERFIRHALDHGVRYFDLIPGPGHRMLATALRGIPRENYVLMTNFRHREVVAPKDMIPQYLKELRTDYIDSVLAGGLTTADWAKQPKWAERREDHVVDGELLYVDRNSPVRLERIPPVMRLSLKYRTRFR